MKKLTSLIVAAAVLALALPALAGKGNADNPGIIPPKAKSHGKTYGEWSVAWWQWLYSIPLAQNPANDTTGEFAGVGQEGPVWFLAGSFSGGEFTRNIIVPPGKSLFFPLINYSAWYPEDLAWIPDWLVAGGVDISGMTDEEIIVAGAQYFIDNSTITKVTIDGKRVKHLEAYRAAAPGLFPVSDELLLDFGLSPGVHMVSSDGYWLMLAPLSRGDHVIEVEVGAFEGEEGAFNLKITYNISVGNDCRHRRCDSDDEP
jgi:hypothetical protein